MNKTKGCLIANFATVPKKEALHAMISAEERKTRASFKMAIFFTAIAIFWTVYI
ncbi:hypothetical protein [Klebsiella pneumoniae]|uniref:hypothetical protein n=1 Tax=Klebsiella pneumoniae TaxID=573 RepID=UPI002E1717BD|nr:hypothetical protein [Klebsiella pneumoniae]